MNLGLKLVPWLVFETLAVVEHSLQERNRCEQESRGLLERFEVPPQVAGLGLNSNEMVGGEIPLE